MPATKRSYSKKRNTVPLMLWVKPQVKAELQRMAQTEGVTLSKIGGMFLEEAIRQKLHIQHSVLLQPIIEESIRKEMTKYSTRLALLLVRVAFDTGVTRSLTRNILGRQPGVTPEMLNLILDKSGAAAKGNITRKTPQLQTVLDEVAQWFKEEERVAEAHG